MPAKKKEVKFPSFCTPRSRSLRQFFWQMIIMAKRISILNLFLFLLHPIHLMGWFVSIWLAFQNHKNREPPRDYLKIMSNLLGSFRSSIITTNQIKYSTNLTRPWCCDDRMPHRLILVGRCPLSISTVFEQIKSIFNSETNWKSIETILSSSRNWMVDM